MSIDYPFYDRQPGPERREKLNELYDVWSSAMSNTRGWSPLIRGESDGDRRVLYVYGWTGGIGTQPETLGYIGSSGLVDTKAQATDLRGTQGLPGVGGDLMQILGGFDASNQTPITDTDTLLGAIGKAQGQINKANLDLAAASGAAMVGFKQQGEGAVARTVQDKMREWVSLKDFGAVGDGIADDTEAIRKAIQSGHPLDWGGAGDIYRIDGMVSEDAPTAINWQSRGAKIVQTSSSVVEATISLSVGAFTHRIDGVLEINASMKSCVGFRVQKLTSGEVYPDDYANFYANGLRVKNVYRANTSFPVSAECIAIRGPFDSIVLDNPVAIKSVLADAAGVSGLYGCFGISISENSYGHPLSVQINNPQVEDVYCEDDSYVMDQDGLRFITSPLSSNVENQVLRVIAGRFKDCRGRSIKSQTENTIVNGTRFVRSKPGFSRGYGNYEIDFQEGGGRAVNIQCIYTGDVPSSVVNFSSTRQEDLVNVPFGSLDGAEVIIGSGLTLEKVFVNEVWSNVNQQIIRASNVEVRGSGDLTYFCEFIGRNDGSGFHLLLSDNIASPTNEWIFCPNVNGTGTIKAIRQINTGLNPINFRRSNFFTWRPLLSARDCIGFNNATSGDNDVSVQGVLERIGTLAGNELAADGGTVRVLSYTLNLNQEQVLPSGGGNNNNGLMFISAAGAQMSGVFARDRTGVYSLAAGTGIVAGTTSEPATGQHRVWYDPVIESHVIKNASGTQRVYTVVLIG